MGTLEEIQTSWRARWKDTPKVVPSCYDHRDLEQSYLSLQFPWNQWKTQWEEGCPHWKAGGNAHVLPFLNDKAGVRLRWEACAGCKHKMSKLKLTQKEK